MESKYTPEEKYYKEYYLNGVLKYHRLPSINKSFHYSDKYQLVIEKDETYGRSSIYYDDIIIQTYIHELCFSEGKEFGFTRHADVIRVQLLISWLVSKIQVEDPKKYINLNFKLCFCKDSPQAEFSFNRLVKKLDTQKIRSFISPDIVNVEKDDIRKMVEKLKIEVMKKEEL